MFSGIYALLCCTLSTILRPVLGYIFRTSPTASKCDLKTVVIVSIVRAFFNHPAPISILKAQEDSLVAPIIKGPVWVVPDEFRVPSNCNVKDALYRAIRALNNDTGCQTIDEVDILPVSGEWVGENRDTYSSDNFKS